MAKTPQPLWDETAFEPKNSHKRKRTKDEEAEPTKKKGRTPQLSDIEFKNYYEDLPKKYHSETIEYPNEPLMKISLPKHILVVGYTGAGKTNWVRNFFDKVGVFTKVYLFAKDLEEPLWKQFIDEMKAMSKAMHGHDLLFVSSDIGQLPNPDDIDKKQNNLIIFDDMITEKEAKLRTAAEYFVRIRKQNGVCVFITQSYFKTPQIIRLQAAYLAIIKLGTAGDIMRIMREQDITDLGKEGLKRIYNMTCGRNNRNVITNFLLIDKNTNEPSYRFRHNFAPIEIEDGDNDTPITADPPKKRKKPDSDEDGEPEEASEDEKEHVSALGIRSRIKVPRAPHPNPFSQPIILQGLQDYGAAARSATAHRRKRSRAVRGRGAYSFHIPSL
jgi:hypothetical protein